LPFARKRESCKQKRVGRLSLVAAQAQAGGGHPLFFTVRLVDWNVESRKARVNGTTVPFEDCFVI